MAESLYVRSLSVDFLGCLDKKQFAVEIAATAISVGFVEFIETEDQYGVVDFDGRTIVFAGALSESDENLMDSTIVTHRIAVAKKKKIAEIDARTGNIIAEGFVYEGKQFSLSPSAQANLIGVYSIRNDAAMTFPVDWNTIDDDDDVYSVVDIADFEAFYLAAFAALRVPLDAGTVLKTSTRAALDVQEVEAIVDAR